MEKMKLGDACEILNGFAFKSENYVEAGIRIIRIANVQKGFVEDNTPAFYPIDSTGLEKFMLDEGDLLISLTGNVGRVAVLEKKFLPAALNQRVACLRLKTDKLSKGFLFHILNSDFFEQQCIQSSKGVAQKNMSTDWLKNYEIPLYPKAEQGKITEILDKVCNVISCRTQQLQKLDNLVKARFVEMFDSGSWDTVRAGSIMFDMRNGISPSNKGSHPAKVLTLSAFTQGAFDAEAWKDGLFDFDPPKEKRVVSSDFYMCRGNGNKKLVGAGVYSTEDRYDLIFPDTVIAASVDQQRVCLPYLSQAWKQPSVRKQIEQGARTTNGTYKINQGVVASVEIKLPPRELQQQFAAFVEQVDKSKVVVQKALDEAQTLFDSLMQQYFG